AESSQAKKRLGRISREEGRRNPLLSRRRGGCTIKKSREATLARADGVVWSRNFLTTPPRPSAGLSKALSSFGQQRLAREVVVQELLSMSFSPTCGFSWECQVYRRFEHSVIGVLHLDLPHICGVIARNRKAMRSVSNFDIVPEQ